MQYNQSSSVDVAWHSSVRLREVSLNKKYFKKKHYGYNGVPQGSHLDSLLFNIISLTILLMVSLIVNWIHSLIIWSFIEFYLYCSLFRILCALLFNVYCNENLVEIIICWVCYTENIYFEDFSWTAIDNL